jgi:hypothetical protein
VCSLVQLQSLWCWKAFPTIWTVWGFSPVCTRWCILSSDESLQRFPQSEQQWDFSPVNSQVYF